MKKIMAFFILGIALLVTITVVLSRSTTSGQVTQDTTTRSLTAKEMIEQPWLQLEEVIPDLINNQYLSRLAQAMKQVIKRDKEFVLSQLLEDNSDITVDFIFNCHTENGASSQQFERIKKSQAVLMAILEERQYDFVGIEGAYDGSYTFDAYRAWCRAEVDRYGLENGFDPPNDKEFRVNFDAMVSESAVLLYLRSNPKVKAFGIESRELHELHSEMIDYCRLAGNSGMDHINMVLSNARSTMALARALFLARNEKMNPVIPYGIAHMEYVTELCQYLKLKGGCMVAE